MKIVKIYAIGLMLIALLVYFAARTSIADNSEVKAADGSAEQKSIVITAGINSSSAWFTYYNLVYSEAFNRLGIKAEIIAFPTKRAAITANSGLYDGVTGRVRDFNSVYKNLVRVDFDIWHTKFCAYTLNPNLTINSWDDLANTNLRVATRLGLKKSTEIFQAIVPTERQTIARDEDEGFALLLNENVDIYVTVRQFGNTYIQHQMLSEKVTNAGTLGEYPVYPFLHKKHAALVPKLKKVLDDMKNEGVIQRLYQQALPAKDH